MGRIAAAQSAVMVPENDGCNHGNAIVAAIAHLIALYAFFAVVTFGAVPAITLAAWLVRDSDGWPAMILAAPLVALALVLGMIAAIVIAKWMVLGRASAGVVTVYGVSYVRKWFVDRLINFSRTFLLPVYATLYTPALMRLLGAWIGRRCEISTVSNITPDFLRIGDESFLADGAMIGGMRIFRGRAEIEDQLHRLANFCGQQRSAARQRQTRQRYADRLHLPAACRAIHPAGRQQLAGIASVSASAFATGVHFDEKLIYRPTRKMFAARLGTDALRILIPAMIAIVQIQLFVMLHSGWPGDLLSAIAMGTAAALSLELGGALCVIALKWMLLGKYRPVVVPLWSRYVWFNEIVNGAF